MVATKGMSYYIRLYIALFYPILSTTSQRKPSLASGLRPRSQRFTAINSDVVDKCYIPGMNAFDTTSYQSQEPNDNLVRMTQLV